jgi:hypothetical protein
MTDHALFSARLKVLAWLVGSLGLSSVGAGAAHACACDSISPAEGFARAQYVFTGKVVEMTGHTWTVDVDWVWKGADKLAARVRLLERHRLRILLRTRPRLPVLRDRGEEQPLRLLPAGGVQLDALITLDARHEPARRDLA